MIEPIIQVVDYMAPILRAPESAPQVLHKLACLGSYYLHDIKLIIGLEDTVPPGTHVGVSCAGLSSVVQW